VNNAAVALTAFLALATTFGLTITLWGSFGIVRLISDRRRHLRTIYEFNPGPTGSVRVIDVAVLIPAHNESMVIERTVRDVLTLVPAENVFVVSDGSKDDTVELAHECGVQVLVLPVAGGKAKALKTAIAAFELPRHFEVVLFLDADTRLDDHYFEAALPLFDDPDVSCVAGCAATVWAPKEMTWRAQVLAAHRDRMYWVFQRLVKYGQSWRYANCASIVPGFASMYRADLLDSIDIDAPGLVIEDFNMTFEVQHRHLGLAAFTPRALAYTQDPHKLKDYYRQLRRWSLGFWQTVRRHGMWVSKFWASLSITMFEVVSSSIVLLATAVGVASLAFGDLLAKITSHLGPIASTHHFLAGNFGYKVVLFGIVLPDYAMTVVTAIALRRPRYLLLGLLFVPMRVVDGMAIMASIPRAWTQKSTGTWVSPERRSNSEGEPATTAA